MSIFEFFTAFSAGILSFLSPCVLPLIPGYISYISGISIERMREDSSGRKINMPVLANTVFFVLGFSVIFIALGASATFLGQLLLQKIELFSKIGGLIIIVFGLHVMGVFRLGFLAKHAVLEQKKSGIKFLSSFLLGMGFAVGWTPCVGPILAGILIYASDKETVLKGIALLSAYSAGIAIPFLITALSVNYFFAFFSKIKKHFRILEIASGLLLVVLGILVFFNKLSALFSFNL